MNSHCSGSSDEPPDVMKEWVSLQVVYIIQDPADDGSKVFLNEDLVLTKLLSSANKPRLGSSKFNL